MKRLTKNRIKILLALLDHGEMYGLQIMRAAGIRSGSLYPALHELRASGLVDASWRPHPEKPDGQPLRYYHLVGDGVKLARYLTSGEPARGWRTVLGPEWNAIS